MLNNVRIVKDITWEEVFTAWRAAEGSDPMWQDFARKERGWDTWEEWRRFHTAPWKPQERNWKLYEITEPNIVIPEFRMGPFRGWQTHFEEKLQHTFRDLVEKAPEWVRSNAGIQNRLHDFPEVTQFMGAYLPSKNVIMLLEGHHRCAAITLAQLDGKPIVFGKNPLIAITVITPEDEMRFIELIEFDNSNPLKREEINYAR